MNFRNQKLKEIRTSLNLTRFQGSKICKMSFFRYADYEDGYILISDKRATKFAKSFDVDPHLFDDDFYLIKPEEIIDEENILQKARHFFYTIPVLIIFLISLITSLTLSSIGGSQLIYTKSNPTAFYTENFKNVQSTIVNSIEREITTLPDIFNLMSITNGKLSEEIQMGDEINKIDFITSLDSKFSNVFATRLTYSSINDENDDEDNDFNNKDISIDDAKDSIDEIKDDLTNGDFDMSKLIPLFLSYIPTNNSLTIISTPIDNRHIDFIFTTKHNNLRYRIDGIYSCGEFNINSIISFSKDFSITHIMNKDDLDAKEILSIFNTMSSNKFNLMSEAFQKKFNLNQDFYSFINDINNSLLIHFHNYGRNLLFLEIFGTIFIVSLLVCLTFLIHYVVVSKKKITNENELRVFDNYPLKMPYKKNFRFNFLIKERYYKIIGLSILFFSNLYLYYLTSKYLDYSTLNISNNIDALLQCMKDLSPVASLIILTITIDRVKNGKNLFLKAFAFITFGLLLAFFEIIIMVELSNFSQLIPLLFSLFPPNTFFAIGIFTFIGMFLFTKPEFIHSNKGLISFRLLAIIPLSILFINYVSVLSSNINISNYAKPFIIQRSIYEILYGVIYLLFLYFSRVYLLKKYGEKRSDIVLNSNRYVLIRNIFICLLISAIGICNIYVKDTNIIKLLKIKSSPYYFYLIPLFLFSKPQIEKENTKETFVYITTLVLSYAIPYLMLFVQINNFISIAN